MTNDERQFLDNLLQVIANCRHGEITPEDALVEIKNLIFEWVDMSAHEIYELDKVVQRFFHEQEGD